MSQGLVKGLTSLAVIGAPSSAGARLVGQEEAPKALRDAGLVSNLRELGFEVVDHGDVAQAVFRPDPAEPTAQNAALVCRVVRDVAEKVGAADADGKRCQSRLYSFVGAWSDSWRRGEYSGDSSYTVIA